MKLITYILTGLLIGALDALPMFRRKVPVFSIVAIWLQWVFIALATAYIPEPANNLIRGALFGFLGMTPFVIQLMFRNRPAVPGSILASIALGALLGQALTWI